MTAHLAESTLILALALAASHLPRLAARTRYAMVFAALLKFALPSTVVPHAVAARVNEPVLLITALRPLTAMPAATPPLPLLVVVWAVVATALMIRLALRWRTGVSTALAGSAPADDPALAAAAARIGLRRRVALRRSPAVPAPVTVGIARPLIVIPENLELSAAELESILVVTYTERAAGESSPARARRHATSASPPAATAAPTSTRSPASPRTASPSPPPASPAQPPAPSTKGWKQS